MVESEENYKFDLGVKGLRVLLITTNIYFDVCMFRVRLLLFNSTCVELV